MSIIFVNCIYNKSIFIGKVYELIKTQVTWINTNKQWRVTHVTRY